MPAINKPTLIALDVGNRRIGIAIASKEVRLAHPLTTLLQGQTFLDDLQQIIATEAVSGIVVGWPRGLDGQHTDQTRSIELFVDKLRKDITVPIYLQDEALTSVRAKAELKARGKIYQQGDVDALAATYILEDYLNQIGRSA